MLRMWYLDRMVRVYTVFSFFVIQVASLKTKNEHYIRFSFFYFPKEKRKTTTNKL